MKTKKTLSFSLLLRPLLFHFCPFLLAVTKIEPLSPLPIRSSSSRKVLFLFCFSFSIFFFSSWSKCEENLRKMFLANSNKTNTEKKLSLTSPPTLSGSPTKEEWST